MKTESCLSESLVRTNYRQLPEAQMSKKRTSIMRFQTNLEAQSHQYVLLTACVCLL